MLEKKKFAEKKHKPANRPILREALTGLNWLELRASPVYYGWNVPHGNGEAVIIVPGFLATDFYLTELYWWLWRVGYHPYLSNIGLNAHCLNKLAQRLSATIERAEAETQRPVHLIGHSLGGILARSAAARQPEKVASVITLGSPFRGIRSHPLVMRISDEVRRRIIRDGENESPDCYTGFCPCETVKFSESPLPETIFQTAVYTKTDGIVDWRMCLSEQKADNYEVSSTHAGMVFNWQVYRLIAKRLRQCRLNTT